MIQVAADGVDVLVEIERAIGAVRVLKQSTCLSQVGIAVPKARSSSVALVVTVLIFGPDVMAVGWIDNVGVAVGSQCKPAALLKVAGAIVGEWETK